MENKKIIYPILIITVLLSIVAVISIRIFFNTDMSQGYPYKFFWVSIVFFIIGGILNNKKISEIRAANFNVRFSIKELAFTLLLMIIITAIFFLIVWAFSPLKHISIAFRFLVAYANFAILFFSLIFGYLFMNCFITNRK